MGRPTSPLPTPGLTPGRLGLGHAPPTVWVAGEAAQGQEALCSAPISLTVTGAAKARATIGRTGAEQSPPAATTTGTTGVIPGRKGPAPAHFPATKTVTAIVTTGQLGLVPVLPAATPTGMASATTELKRPYLARPCEMKIAKPQAEIRWRVPVCTHLMIRRDQRDVAAALPIPPASPPLGNRLAQRKRHLRRFQGRGRAPTQRNQSATRASLARVHRPPLHWKQTCSNRNQQGGDSSSWRKWHRTSS